MQPAQPEPGRHPVVPAGHKQYMHDVLLMSAAKAPSLSTFYGIAASLEMHALPVAVSECSSPLL
jgi:hypothetical protein